MWTYRVDDLESISDGYGMPIDCPLKSRTVYIIIGPDGKIRDYLSSREEAREECHKLNQS